MLWKLFCQGSKLQYSVRDPITVFCQESELQYSVMDPYLKPHQLFLCRFCAHFSQEPLQYSNVSILCKTKYFLFISFFNILSKLLNVLKNYFQNLSKKIRFVQLTFRTDLQQTLETTGLYFFSVHFWPKNGQGVSKISARFARQLVPPDQNSKTAPGPKRTIYLNFKTMLIYLIIHCFLKHSK